MSSRRPFVWAIGPQSVIILAVAISVAGRSLVAHAGRYSFPDPPTLHSRVSFWTDAFSTYSWRDFLVHDRDDIWNVYEVFHLPGSGRPTNAEIAATEKFLIQKYRHILNSLARGKRPIDEDQRRVAELLGDASARSYTEAAGNLRVQQGLRELFIEGMQRSVHYRAMMRRVFRKLELPDELWILAAVESQFNPHARSSAGAVGIWQFVRSTARSYGLVHRHHDYRYDPRRSTEAAARLLRANYESLGSWPLAITAYDYGGGAMARAARRFHGDYMQILEHHRDPNFGFAVENYYSEFLAALDIYRHPGDYFPVSAKTQEISVKYRVRSGDTLSQIAKRFGVSAAGLAAVNHVGRPQNLKVGELLSITSAVRPSRARVHTRRYTVRRGDTLYELSKRYGVSVKQLAELNRIRNPQTLAAGRTIRLP